MPSLHRLSSTRELLPSSPPSSSSSSSSASSSASSAAAASSSSSAAASSYLLSIYHLFYQFCSAILRSLFAKKTHTKTHQKKKKQVKPSFSKPSKNLPQKHPPPNKKKNTNDQLPPWTINLLPNRPKTDETTPSHSCGVMDHVGST